MIPQLNKIQQAKDGIKVMVDEITKKYHEDFDKIEAEFKAVSKDSVEQNEAIERMQNYIKGIEDKWDVKFEAIEKKVGELEKTRETKTN
jgi:predicted  nucleic acid-binding Zn-ribbon protein